MLNVFNSFLQLIDGHRLLNMYLNLGIGLGGIRREYRSKLYAGHSTSALPLMTLMTRMKLGECNNIHRCVAPHAILYFLLAILINYFANLNM